MDSCSVPPGFRFHPTDEELVGYYLKKKVASQEIDLDVIGDVDIYRIEPWDLQERCRIACEEQAEWYFFSRNDRKYPAGTRSNRATAAGFWKATGRDKAVHDGEKLIGMRKTLVYYKGRAPHGEKSDWIMHEYRLQAAENGSTQEEGWVVCRAFKKRSNGQMSPIIITETRNRNSHNCYCPPDPPKTHLKLLHQHPINGNFMQLPQLESPHKFENTSIKDNEFLPSLIPSRYGVLCMADSQQEESGGMAEEVQSSARDLMVSGDWRVLEKFVASQLGQDRDDRPAMALVWHDSIERNVEEEEKESVC